MTAVNAHIMSSSIPLDYGPHSRSSSVSSHSSISRPHSSQGGFHPDDLYRNSYIHGDHVRDSFSPFPLSLTLADHDARQSPPTHTITKGPIRQTHNRARVAASPYPRDTDSVHSSSSETDDLSMYLANGPSDYHGMFAGGQTMAPSPDTMHPASAFGRMAISPDHSLEKLAANVRVATTTSASDRAKQIFVQAWYVFESSRLS